MESTITVNLREGSFTISGSEEFVEKNKEELKEFITSFNLLKKTSEDIEKKCIDDMPISSVSNKYIQNGIYAIDQEDGAISILKKIPGKNNAEKTKNVALIVLHAKGKDEKILGSDIIGLCEKQKCYDSKNFAAIFKRDITNFIMKGKGQGWTLQLSVPGEKNAIELLESMCNNE